MIITPYLDAAPLYDFFGQSDRLDDIEMAILIYKQITSALACLMEYGVVHNDINENTILVELQNGQYTSYLTGFSEYAIAESTTDQRFHRDLSNLTSTVEKLLLTLNGLPCCDPELRLLMVQAKGGKISVQKMCAALDEFAPDFEKLHFQTSIVSKEMSIKRIVDDNDIEGIRLIDFLRIILHESPKDLRKIEVAIQKVIRTERLLTLGEDTYCSLIDAEKLLHQSVLRHCALCPLKSCKLVFPFSRGDIWSTC
jgi:hypothetical protein